MKTHYIGDGCHAGHEQDAEIARLRAAIKSLEAESDGYFEQLGKAEAVVRAARTVELESSPIDSPSMGSIERLREALAAYRERA